MSRMRALNARKTTVRGEKPACVHLFVQRIPCPAGYSYVTSKKNLLFSPGLTGPVGSLFCGGNPPDNAPVWVKTC